MALITAVQYSGFTITPLLGVLFGSLGAKINNYNSIVAIDQFSLPAYILISLAFIQVLLLLLAFEDQNRVLGLTSQVYTNFLLKIFDLKHSM